MAFWHRPSCTSRCILLLVALPCILVVMLSFQKYESTLTAYSYLQDGVRTGTSSERQYIGSTNKTKTSSHVVTSSPVYALVLTYARSGSSWLGDIISHAPNTFYVFEPFQGVIKEGYYSTGDVICFNNNTCRKARHEYETNRYMINQVSYIYKCQLHKIDFRIWKTYHNKIRHTVGLQSFNDCLKTQSKSDCFQVLESICRNTSQRIIKTIRVSMGLMTRMFNLLPNLRVVQLIRDPRAVTNSRSKLGAIFKMAGETDSHTLDMCKRIDYDLGKFRDLRENQHKLVDMILYEDLVERTSEVTQHVYNFFGLSMTPDVLQWLYESTHAEPTDRIDAFGTVREDPVAMANKWRTSLVYSDVQYIDKTCAKVYVQLGYLPMKSEADLRNITIPSRVSMIYT